MVITLNSHIATSNITIPKIMILGIVIDDKKEKEAACSALT